MESPYSGDPAFLETCHRWLLFHYHCKDCGLSEDACEYGKVCSYGKSTFTHVRCCTRAECSFPRCDLIKSILRHHEACKDESCQVCAPVRKYQARSKAPPPSPPQLPFAHVPAATSSATCASTTSPMQCSDQQIPSQVQPPQQTQKRCSLKAELDQAQPQQTGPQYSADPQSKSQPAGMLFEARHREQKRHLSSSLGHSSWTPDTATATASGSSSGSGSGGCAMATAPSGSIEAAAELQALQLDKSAQQQQPNLAIGGQAQQTPESLARQSAPPPLQEQLGSPGSRGGGGGSGTAGGGSLPPAGDVAQQQSRSTGPAPALQMAAGLQQQQTQQLLQPPTQSLQQGGMSYGGTALTVLLQPPVHQQHPQQPTVIMQPMQPRNPPQLHHQQPLVQHLPLSVAHHQPMFGTMQFITQPGAIQASSQLQLSAQQPKLPQPFGGDAMAASGRNGSSAPPYMSLPYGTMLQQPVQLGAAAPGMSYTVVHHHYGTAGPATGAVLLPSTQPHQHHQQLQQQQFQLQQQQQHLHQVHPQQQQQQPMILASGGPMPAGSAFFVGPQPVAGLAAPLGCGPGAAMDGSSGGGPGATANWGTYQPSGFQHSLMLAQQQQQQQQQQQHLSGHFPAASSGSTGTPMLVAPQLAGAGAT